MTTLFGDFHTVLGDASTATITIRSLINRSGTEAPGMITTEGDPLALVDGSMPEVEVDPGPTVVTLEGGGVSAQWVIDTPTEGRHDISSLAELQYDYEPAVVSQAVAAKDEAIRQADRSTTEADRAEAAAEHVDDVVSDGAAAVRGEFTELTERSESAAVDSEASAATSAAQATAAGDSEALAAAHAEAAATSEAAAEAAQAVATSEADRSKDSADISRSYNDTAWKYRGEAIAAKGEAETAQSEAEEAQAGAEAAEAGAAGSATAAQDAATNAADEVRADLTGLTERSEGAAAAADASEAAAKVSEDKAREYSIAAGEVVSNGVPGATDSSKGVVQLAGDLAGTADAPTVPGLEGKADTDHTHEAGDVDGLPAAMAALDEATYAATPGAIAQRGADGTIAVADPSAAGHAATRSYVDSAADGVADDATSAIGDSAQAGRLVKTDSAGFVTTGTPTEAGHVTPKSYVDTRTQVVASEADVGTEPGVLYLVPEEV